MRLLCESSAKLSPFLRLEAVRRGRESVANKICDVLDNKWLTRDFVRAVYRTILACRSVEFAAEVPARFGTARFG